MAEAFSILDYMAGLTTYEIDDVVLKRIAYDRNVINYQYYEQLTQKDKDLILADILYTIWVGANNIPSHQHQHGQFSTSTGSQTMDKESVYEAMKALYDKWGDDRLDTAVTSNLNWIPGID